MSGTFLGRPVRRLQTMLRQLSAVHPEIPAVIPDGIYGEATMRAVTAMQRFARLPATGVADTATWDALDALSRDAAGISAPPAPLCIRMAPGLRIAGGEANSHLYLVQGMLRALSEVLSGVPEVESSGQNDERCCAALRWLQARAELPQTGELDRCTWEHLVGLYRLAVGSGTSHRGEHTGIV